MKKKKQKKHKRGGQKRRGETREKWGDWGRKRQRQRVE